MLDYSKAIEYFKKSSDQGNSFALFYIDRQYQRGYGVERDFLKAAEYYIKSSELGNAMPHNNLSWLYQKGNGVEQTTLEQ